MRSILWCAGICLFSLTHGVAQTRAQAKEPIAKPFVLGDVREIQSVILGETRTLNVYLPQGYNARDTTHYPVIYLLDGSANEDFIHVAGLVQFCSFEWVNYLPPSILVGIANVDRKRDFTLPSSVPEEQQKFPTAGHSEAFIQFLEKELQPFIAKTYHVNGSSTLIGESLGGLLGAEILLKRPSLFNRYILVSPSLWWNNGALLDQGSEVLNANFINPTEVYIGVGKEGRTPTKLPRIMEVDANLLADKLKAGKSRSVRVVFDYLPEDNHGTIMHQATFNAFKLLGKKP